MTSRATLRATVTRRGLRYERDRKGSRWNLAIRPPSSTPLFRGLRPASSDASEVVDRCTNEVGAGMPASNFAVGVGVGAASRDALADLVAFADLTTIRFWRRDRFFPPVGNCQRRRGHGRAPDPVAPRCRADREKPLRWAFAPTLIHLAGERARSTRFQVGTRTGCRSAAERTPPNR